MIVKTAENYSVSELKMLWKTVFGDTDEYISLFFNSKFKPENTFIIEDNGLKSMAFVVEEKIVGYRCAYICAVATDSRYRGMGYSSDVMNYMLNTLEKRGYDMAFLIPASGSLFGFYEKYGFGNLSYLKKRTILKSNIISDEEFSEEYDYKKLNRFYTEYFEAALPERDEKSFRAIYDCYGNVRIYKSGYIIYYVEKDVLYINEHTMGDIEPYAGRLLADTNTAKAVVSEFDANRETPFSMVYYFKNIEFNKPVYINLMLN